MRTIVSESQRFPNPKAYLPILVVKDWVEKRIIELGKQTQTPAIAQTLEKLKKIDVQTALIETPVIIEENRVKVCILSRQLGTLWLDEPIKKITFDDFLSLVFDDVIPNSTLYRAEPYTLTELEAIVRSDKSAPIPGYINVVDETGKVKKAIIGDVLNEDTLHREALFGEYGFEKATTDVYGYDGDGRPVYPFTSLDDLSIAITTLEDRFLKENVTIHSISISLLRSLIQENDKPAKITSAVIAGDSTVVEQDAPATYDITNSLDVTFDKAPKPSDLVVKELKDGNGETVPEVNYSVRVLGTSDPKVMNLEINLVDYQRRFFAPDIDGKKFSFEVTLVTAGVTKETKVTLPVVWQNTGNTHFPVFYSFANTADVLTKFPLKLSLKARTSGNQVADLKPLTFKDIDSLLKAAAGNASVLDTEYVLGTTGSVPTVQFNLKAKNYGLIDLAFKDGRIISQMELIADPAGVYASKVLDSSYYAQSKRLMVSHLINSPYDDVMGETNLVRRYKDLLVSVNGTAGIKPEVGYVVDGGNVFLSLTVPYASEETPVNVPVKVTGIAYFGLNEVEVPFTTDYIHNEVKEELAIINKGVSNITKNSDGKYQIGEGLVITSTVGTTTPESIELVSLHDALGNDVTSKSMLVLTKNSQGEFTGHIELAADYAFPLGFKDADGKEGIFAITVGVKGSPESVSSVSIPYGVTRANASFRAWVTAITTDTQTAAAKDSAVMEVAFLDANNQQVKEGIDNDYPADYDLFGIAGLNYLGGGIKFGKNADGRTVAKIKTKFADYGNFILTFKDPAFKGDPSAIADPSAAYALNPISAVINTQFKTLTLTHALQKDGADYSICVAKYNPGEPKATIDGVAGKSPGSSGWNYTVTPAISSVSYSSGDKTVVGYNISNGTMYLGANHVPVAISASGTGYTADGGPADPTPGMVDKDGHPIADGGTTADNKPVLSGDDMKPGSTVTLTDNGTPLGTVIIGNDGKWTFTPDPALVNGEHAINIKGTDKNEMVVDKTITININTSGGGGGVDPDPINATPGLKDKDGNVIANGGATTDNKPTLSGSDMKPGSTVTIKDGETTLGTAVVGEDGTWSYTPENPLSNGEHELSVGGTDKNDKVVDEKTTVVVDVPEEGGGTDPEQTAEEKALADPTEGGKYSGPGESGFGSTMETYPEVTEAKPAYNLSATPIVMIFPYVEKGSID